MSRRPSFPCTRRALSCILVGLALALVALGPLADAPGPDGAAAGTSPSPSREPLLQVQAASGERVALVVEAPIPGEEGATVSNLTFSLAATGLLVGVAAAPHAEPPAAGGQVAAPRSLWRRFLRKVPALLGIFRWVLSSEALGQETRNRIREVIRGRPGLDAGEIAGSLGLARQTVLYHLRIMERLGVVTSQRWKRRTYYCNGRSPRTRDTEAAGATVRGLVARLQEGISSADDLAFALGLSRRGVTWHLRRLVDANIVTRTREGRRVVYRLTADARRAPIS